MIPTKYTQKLVELLAKGFEKSGTMGKLVKLIHPISGREVVLTRDLKLLADAEQTLKNKASVRKPNLQSQGKKIAQRIFNTAKEKGLGLVDFSLPHWKSLAPGHIMTPDEKQLFLSKTLPQIEKTFNSLVSKGKLIRTEEGIIGYRNGKRFVLKTPQEVMAHIMMCTPQGRKLMWTGRTFYSGTRNEFQREFEAYGGLTKTHTGKGENFDTWLNTDKRGAKLYQNLDEANGGFSAYIAPVKASKAIPYLKSLGVKTEKARDTPYIIPTDISEPLSAHYNKNEEWVHEAMMHPVNGITPYAPLHFAVTERPVIDEVATYELGPTIRGYFGIIGKDLPRKAIFGGSGQYDLSKPGLFKTLLPLGLLGDYVYRNKREKESRAI